MALDAVPAVAKLLRRGSSGSESDEADRFYQDRIAFYARVMGIFFAGMWLAGAIAVAVLAPRHWAEVHGHPSKIANLLFAVLLIGAWAVLRKSPRSGDVLRAFDLGLPLLISMGIGYGVASTPPGYHFALVGLLILVLTLVLRAAIVPSQAGWTAWVGALSSPAVVWGGYRHAPTLATGPSHFPAALVLCTLIAWCIASTAVTAVVSRVIYGLVVQVREAMRLGQYTLREKIGEGGMGAVYRAEHALLRRATALKLLLPERTSPENLTRFEREVQLTSQLSHPNTIAIYDYGRTPEGILYFAMEYLTGRTLHALIADQGPQPPGRVVHFMQQIAGSLREAHEVGLIHRDIKPGNVILSTRGGIAEFIKVIDFGLVKRVEAGGDPAVTRTDAIAGTPLYMAPECITEPDSVSAASDVYSLGCVAYFLATGSPPFGGTTVVEVCSHHLHTAPTPPSERLPHPLPGRLEALVLRCLAKAPAERPTDAELASCLADCARESPWAASLVPASLAVPARA